MRELTALTGLIIFLYGSPTAVSCPADRHTEAVAAMAECDVSRAEKLMLESLDPIEARLSLTNSAIEVGPGAVLRA